MSRTGSPYGPAWFDISTPDAPRARRFFHELFGWPVHAIDESPARSAAAASQQVDRPGWARGALHRDRRAHPGR